VPLYTATSREGREAAKGTISSNNSTSRPSRSTREVAICTQDRKIRWNGLLL